MLDDNNVIDQRDPSGALRVAATQWEQTTFEAEVQDGAHDERRIETVVVAGMGGSSLAALLAKSWLKDVLTVPMEVVRTYALPAYVGPETLVIVSSCSGNTEETLSCLAQAREVGAQIAIMSSGGALLDKAQQLSISHVVLPDRTKIEPRMTTIAQLRACTMLLAHFGIITRDYYDQIAQSEQSLEAATKEWTADVSTDKNYAKQLALIAVGKTPVFYGGSLTAPVAYKWKISWNENAKNVAFWNEYPEFNHNEFLGWTSHPIEKPFVIFDLVSHLEHSQILKRFEVSDRLLSGMRPKANTINLQGETLIAQLLWGSIFADFVSIYVAILNGVDPTPVAMIEKLKAELA